MDYTSNAYQNSVPGAAIGSGLAGIGQLKQEAPRTLASAGSRLETLNERLAKATDALSMVCSQIGAMSALNQLSGARSTAETSPGGVVYRLNDAADEAHAKLSAIEGYIVSLQRALG